MSEKMSGNNIQQTTVEQSTRYVVVTPARNESAYIEKTIKSMINQTVLPCEWIIVDDGSADTTADIIEQYSLQYGWLKLIRNPSHRERRDIGGGAPAKAFNLGLRQVNTKDYDFVVKMDADLSFEPNYFELLLKEFADDPRLGIAGGNVYEFRHGVARPRGSYALHVAGATKVYRRKCFLDIGGVVESVGWDAIDEITARMKGWNTQTFANLKLLHYRRTFSSEGNVLIGFMRRGRIDYLLGSHPVFELLKVMGTMVTIRPYVLTGLSMAYGYLKAALKREQRPVSPEFVMYVRQTQMQRIRRKLSLRNNSEMNIVRKSN